MAIIKAISSRASIAKAINYIVQKEKTDLTLIRGKDCISENAIDEMKLIKKLWSNEGGRQYKHYIQSFNPIDKITPEKAHEIGIKWMEQERFKGHQIIMATHVDKGHIHTHFIVNSVNFETGKKFQESKKNLQRLKDFSNQLSKENNLTVPQKDENFLSTFNGKKYQVITKAMQNHRQSYVLDIGKAVNEKKKTATSKSHFIKELNMLGIQVNWKEKSKHVTFVDQDNHHVRLANLQKTFKDKSFTKESLEDEFRCNAEKHQRGEKQTGVFKQDDGRRISFSDIGKELRENKRLRNTMGNHETEFRSIDDQFRHLYERKSGTPEKKGIANQSLAEKYQRSNEHVLECSRDNNQENSYRLQREDNEIEPEWER
ncbi:MAG: relaxase/mobilization nuclease domain-containing protein [Eubacteriaceae bacterium]